MEERIYKVYMHTNMENNKKYIGITMQENMHTRWKNGRGYSHNTHFSKAIKKYGWDNFKHEILFKNLTKEEAENKEVELIKKYKTLDREFGYNLDSGGRAGKKMSEETKIKIGKANKGKIVSKETCKMISESHKGKKLSKEHIEKISKANSGSGNHFYGQSLCGEKNGMYGKKHSEESKANMSKNKKGKYIGKNSHMYGKKLSNETKYKIYNTKKEKYYRKVICIENGEVFESIAEAGRKMGLNRNNIQCCCAGKSRSIKGYHFLYYENYIIGKEQECQDKRFRKVICIETNIIYKSIVNASINTGIHKDGIIQCCKGKQKTSGGYHWEYYNENR